MSYSKEKILEILRSKDLFIKKKEEIVQFFKDEASLQVTQQTKQIEAMLGGACSEIISGEGENSISKMNSSLIIKDVMDLGQPPVLLAVSQHLLPLMKTIVIKSKDEEPMGKNFFSKKPTAEQEQIGINIVQRFAECLFTWACWHYRNSNGTKTRFFLALEESMRAGVKFPEEQFLNFTREELFKYQGRSGYQEVMNIKDLLNMTDQLGQTIVFLKDQFSNGQNTVDEQTLAQCLKLFEDYSSEAQSKDHSYFFHEDKLVYDVELKFVNDILPQLRQYTNKTISFDKFSSSVARIIEAYYIFGKKIYNKNDSQLEKQQEELKKEDKNSQQNSQSSNVANERIRWLEAKLLAQNDERLELEKKNKELEFENEQLKKEVREGQSLQYQQQVQDMKAKHSNQVDELQQKIDNLNQVILGLEGYLLLKQAKLDDNFRQGEINVSMKLEQNKKQFDECIRNLTEELWSCQEQLAQAQKKIKEQQDALEKHEGKAEKIKGNIEKNILGAEQAGNTAQKKKVKEFSRIMC